MKNWKVNDEVKLVLDEDEEALPSDVNGMTGNVVGFSGDREHGTLVVVKVKGLLAAVWPHELEAVC